nr:hypothetical protein [Tanacetum cinerariifolium]
MPPKPDLVFHHAPNVTDTAHTTFNVELSPSKPNTNSSHAYRSSVPIIEDWISDLEDDYEAETAIPKPKNNRNYRNIKECFVCKSLDHLIKDYDFYEKKMAQTSVRKHDQRGNPQQYARMALPYPQKHVVLTAVLTKSKLVPITAARPVTVDEIQVSNGLGLKEKLTIFFLVKGNSQHALKDKGVIDSGCSPHMTGNMSYLSDFEELNGGYVAFGGNPKGGSGPTWLFDIDTLTKTMNYQPVTAGNQSNPNAGVQEQFDAEKARKESAQQYVLFPVGSSSSTNPQNTDNDAAFGSKEPEFEGRKPESEVYVSPSR